MIHFEKYKENKYLLYFKNKETEINKIKNENFLNTKTKINITIQTNWDIPKSQRRARTVQPQFQPHPFRTESRRRFRRFRQFPPELEASLFFRRSSPQPLRIVRSPNAWSGSGLGFRLHCSSHRDWRLGALSLPRGESGEREASWRLVDAAGRRWGGGEGGRRRRRVGRGKRRRMRAALGQGSERRLNCRLSQIRASL